MPDITQSTGAEKNRKKQEMVGGQRNEMGRRKLCVRKYLVIGSERRGGKLRHSS